jgi:ribosomal protein S27AE
MSPDKNNFTEILANLMPTMTAPVHEGIANSLIAAGATLTETAEWKVPEDNTKNRPYCTRCGEDSLFDGWGFPAWSRRCPNCGAIMTNANEE